MTARPVGAAPTISAWIRQSTGQNAAKCYQCGKCSAGCPMAAETSLRPHDVLRLVHLDREAELLASEDIWLCLACETCTARCPNGMDPARVVDALRERTLSQRKGRPPRAIRAFHDAFLAQIRTHGRLFEFGLVLGYKLRTGKLFSDVNQVPAMLARGKLSFAPQPFDSVADIRRIFDECRDDGTTGSDMEGAA